jgi:H+/gluconate symporter-like permease
MPGVGQFIGRYFPLFLLGAIFGAQMQRSGAARRIAVVLTNRFGSARAIPAVVLTCALLPAGGVSLFVVVFAVYPIAEYLFRRASMRGEGFGVFADEDPAAVAGAGSTALSDEGQLPSAWASFAPIGVVLLANLLMSFWILPGLDTSYLGEARFGGTNLSRVPGTWSAILSLLLAVGLAGVLFSGSVRRLNEWLSEGAHSSLLPVFNTAMEYGYGTTIASLAGVAGSASGGLSIALESLGASWVQQGMLSGVDPELMHRESYMDIGVVSVLIPLLITLLAVLYGLS